MHILLMVSVVNEKIRKILKDKMGRGKQWKCFFVREKCKLSVIFFSDSAREPILCVIFFSKVCVKPYSFREWKQVNCAWKKMKKAPQFFQLNHTFAFLSMLDRSFLATLIGYAHFKTFGGMSKFIESWNTKNMWIIYFRTFWRRTLEGFNNI